MYRYEFKERFADGEVIYRRVSHREALKKIFKWKMIDTLKVRRAVRRLEGLKIPLVRTIYKFIVLVFWFFVVKVVLEGLGIL